MPVKISDYARLGIQKQERDFSSNKNNQTTSGNKGFDLGKALISPFTTIADINEDVLSGVGKSLEGIVDYGLGLVGSAASIFGSNDLERALSEAIKYDFTGNTIGKMDDWAEDSSWLSGDNWVSNTVHQVGQGVGGMLPGIAVTLATGGAAAPAALASMSGLLGTATFAAGAAGQSTEEALHEGANIGQATAFGTLTGATEGAIEYISGGLGGLNLFTKGAAGKILSGGAGKVFRSFAEEGLEEVASDLITPAWKAITYSGKYETPEINELINSFTTGGLTALAMGGAGKATNMAMYGKDGEKALSKLNEIQELNEEEYNLEKKGELNEEKAKEFADKRENLVKEFKDLTDSLDKESKKYQRLDERINVDKSIENAKNFDVRWEAAKEALFHNNKNTGQNYTLEMEDIKNKNINGYIDKENNRIVVNKNAKDPVAIVVGHEVTHGLEKSGAYNEVKDLILSKMSAEELQEQRNELLKIKQYKKAFDKDGNIALDKEIVANWLSNNMTKDSKSLIQTFKGKGNVLERLLGFAKNKLSTLTKGTQTYNEYQDVVDAINKAMDTLKKQNIRENRTVEEKINDLKSKTKNESVAYSVASVTTPSVRVESKNGEVTYKTTQELTEEQKILFGEKHEKIKDSKIQYSISSDSKGNKLTKNQEEYFKDSKARDENGNLLVLYHGTPNAGFTTVNEGGLYLTNHEDVAQDYAGSTLKFDSNNPKADLTSILFNGKKTYLTPLKYVKDNIYNYTMNEIIEMAEYADSNSTVHDYLYDYLGVTEEDFDMPLKKIKNKYDLEEFIEILFDNEEGLFSEEYVDELPTTDYTEGVERTQNRKVYEVYANVTNPYEISGRKIGYTEIQYAKKNGHDAIISRNAPEGRNNKRGTTIVVLNSNQVKLTSNKNPTSNDDFQYSIRRSKNPPKGQLELELDFDAKEKQRKLVEPSTRKVAKEMKEYNRQQNLTEQDIDKVIADTEKKVEVVLPADKKSTMQVVKDKFKEAKEAFKSGRLATYLKTQITDASAGVVDKVKAKYKDNKELRNSKVKQLRISVNEAQRATARADWYIGTVVDKIWSPIEAKGEAYVRSFETFLLHKLNIRRMRFSATALNNIAKLEKELDAKLVELADKYNKGGYKTKKAYELDVSKTKSKYATKITSWQEEYRNAKDAPVFGEEITAKESEEAAKKLLKEHPEFAEYKEQVADVFEYLRKKQLEAGLISETQFELMEKAAGRDYVPTHRVNKDGISKAALSGNIGVKNGLHRAKGSSEDIRSIMVQMCEQVIAVEKKTSINKLFNTVKEMIPEEFTDDKIVSREPVGREDADSNIIPEQNQVFFYENGERVVYQVDGEVASLFQSMRNIPSQFELGIFGKASKGLVKLTRNVTTQYNPFFAARNLFRDYFDAVIYTKNKGNFSQNYVEAAKDVFGKGKWYKMYMENGGASASFYNQDQGRDMSKKGILSKISDFNETIELIPRVAEMKATYERLIAEGKTHEEAIQEAMFDAAEVTVNFGKGGTSTKWLSSNLVPYLNGAVQGSVKFYDTFIHPESFEAWKSAMVRAGLMAIPALILNEAIFGDDDDYEELADDVKANYYLFKIGDNKFIRIPRGRIEAIFGDFAQRTVRYAKGNEDAFDTYGETIKSSVSPVESFTRTVYSPLKDVSTNTAWHGGKIENRSMENKPIKERYDENTSEIAKMLSNVYPKLSPKKWHYLLDQYSGVIGDIVLPLTSKSASIETVLFKSSGYYVNSMNNNKYSNQYYDLGAELTQNSNSNNATGVDKAKLRYYNSMNTKISELKKSKDGLSNEEAEATQLLIVQLQRQTIDNLKAFETTLNKYEYGLSDSDTYEDFYRESLRECFGAETALLSYDNRVYEKATIFNKCGINWDTFYTVYFDAKSIDSDYDADGNVVSGSKKNKVTNYVKSLKLNATQKYMVMGLLGYKNTNGESQVRSLLRSKGYTGEELESVMKMCGYGK